MVYSVGVARNKQTFTLLEKVDEFLAWFSSQPEKAAIDRKWLGKSRTVTLGYRDFSPDLVGVKELRAVYGEDSNENNETQKVSNF